jgi:hypothetical protein
MERKEKPKQPATKNKDKKAELKTDPPISEKDEVKQAEERMKTTRKGV